MSFVVSPNFNGLENMYPKYHKATFFLDVPSGYSVLTNFIVYVFEILNDFVCGDFDKTKFEVVDEDRFWYTCGINVSLYCLKFAFVLQKHLFYIFEIITWKLWCIATCFNIFCFYENLKFVIKTIIYIILLFTKKIEMSLCDLTSVLYNFL